MSDLMVTHSPFRERGHLRRDTQRHKRSEAKSDAIVTAVSPSHSQISYCELPQVSQANSGLQL